MNPTRLDKKVMSFLCVLLNALTLLFIVIPAIRSCGYVGDQNGLLPFVKTFSQSTNSLFLYLIGCLLVGIVAYIYYNQVITKFLNSRHLLAFEMLKSTLFLLFIQAGHLEPLGLWGMSVYIVYVSVSVFLLRRFLSTEHWEMSITFSYLLIIYTIISSLLYYTHLYIYFFELSFPQLFIFLVFSMLGFWSFRPKSKVLFKAVYIIDIVVVLLIALFTIKNDPSYFDYSIIIGPINDIILGKDIGMNVISTYGILNIYFAAYIFKILAVQDYYVGLSYLVSAFYFLGYSIIYLFLRVTTKHVILSFLAISFVMNIHYSLSFIPIHWLPQVGFFRFGGFLVVSLILYYIEDFKGHKCLEWLLASLISVAILWSPETGIYILVSFLGLFVLRRINRETSLYLDFYGKILICLVVMIFLHILYLYVKYNSFPSVSSYTYHQRLFGSAGIAMNQLTEVGLWVLPPLIYYTCLYVCCENRTKIKHLDYYIFNSLFGLQSMFYFIGKQGIYDLARVTLPSILLVAGAISYCLNADTFKCTSNGRFIRVSCCLFMSFCAVVSWNECISSSQGEVWIWSTKKALIELMESEAKTSTERFLIDSNSYARFLEDVNNIRSLTSSTDSLAIISKIDTLYYVASERKSLFNNSFYPHTFTQKEVQEILKSILSAEMEYLFIDNRSVTIYNNMVVDYIDVVVEGVMDKYERVGSLNYVDIYRLRL